MQNLEIINVYIFFSLEDLQPSGASVLLWRFKVNPVWKPVLLRPRWRQVYHVEVLADSYTKMAPLSSRASGTNDDIDHTFWPLFGAINVCKSRIIIEKTANGTSPLFTYWPGSPKFWQSSRNSNFLTFATIFEPHEKICTKCSNSTRTVSHLQ